MAVSRGEKPPILPLSEKSIKSTKTTSDKSCQSRHDRIIEPHRICQSNKGAPGRYSDVTVALAISLKYLWTCGRTDKHARDIRTNLERKRKKERKKEKIKERKKERMKER